MIWNELKWVPSEKQLDQFILLQELLKEWNKKTNLSFFASTKSVLDKFR